MNNVLALRKTELEDLYTMKESGLSLREISLKTGIPKSSVATKLREYLAYQKAKEEMSVQAERQPPPEPECPECPDPEQPPVQTEVTQENESSLKTIKDFISGKSVYSTPEEIQVQTFAKRLVNEYGYPTNLIRTHSQWQVGRALNKRRIDIGVFGSLPQSDKNLKIIVECKRLGHNGGSGQLQDYLMLSSAKYGVLFNGRDVKFIKKSYEGDQVVFHPISNIPKYSELLAEMEPDKTDSLLSQIQTMRHEGYSLREIGEKLKMSKDTVHRRLRETENEPPTVQASGQSPEVVTATPTTTWMSILWRTSIAVITFSMLLFLVVNSQPFYAKSTNSSALGWLLSCSLELLLFVLSSTNSMVADFFSPRSISAIAKWILLRCAILGLAFFSFKATTIHLDVQVAEQTSNQPVVQSLLADLEAERALLSEQQKAGAIGAGRETARRMESIRESIASREDSTPALVQALDEKLAVEKALRAIAIAVVILLGHLVGSRKEKMLESE